MRTVRKIFIGIALAPLALVALLMAGSAIDTLRHPPRETAHPSLAPQPLGSPRVFAKIDTMTSCIELQATFDRAYATNKSAHGKVLIYTGNYMTTAHDRMREIGCYE